MKNRLERFICHIHRYPLKDFSTELLERWLIEDEKFSSVEAKRFVTDIRFGQSLLKKYKTNSY